MPEPTGIARLVGEILPRIYWFTMHDDRIDDESDSYVIIEKGRTILIDPLPMSDQDLKQLSPVEAICLTSSCHERSAWRYRRSLKAPIYAPQDGVYFRSLRTTGMRPITPSILNETGASCSAAIF